MAALQAGELRAHGGLQPTEAGELKIGDKKESEERRRLVGAIEVGVLTYKLLPSAKPSVGRKRLARESQGEVLVSAHGLRQGVRGPTGSEKGIARAAAGQQSKAPRGKARSRWAPNERPPHMP